MAITGAICKSYKQECLQGIHLAADVYKLALFTSAATLDKTTTAYSTTNEAAGPGYSAGGITLSSFTTSLVGDTAILTFADPSIANASITARGALIYNSSKSNKAVCVLDFGADITSTNGTFLVDFGNASAANASVSFVASSKRIVRGFGSFLTENFQVGHTVVTSSTLNPGPFTITAVGGSELTVSETVVDQAAAATTVSEVLLGWL